MYPSIKALDLFADIKYISDYTLKIKLETSQSFFMISLIYKYELTS